MMNTRFHNAEAVLDELVEFLSGVFYGHIHVLYPATADRVWKHAGHAF